MTERTTPPLAAFFLVVFDQKIGYKIAWQKTAASVELSGVEYKSLPSGLHEQTRDVVYFKHEGYAGISVFVRAESDAEHRNAQFAAVGALVDAREGDHDLAWRLAEPLNRLAEGIVQDLDDYSILEQHWRDNAKAQAVAAGQHSISSEDHPDKALSDIFDRLGPLLFPLQRQALAGRRILIAAHPPVLANCRIVYALTQLGSTDRSKQIALFSVGIADMATLNSSSSWIACTTDAILRDKNSLYDVLVDLPLEGNARIIDAQGIELKATQRDLRRFQALHQVIQQPETAFSDDPNNDQDALLTQTAYEAPQVDNAVIEPYSWSSVAIRSIAWLQSPDEAAATLQEESEIEQDLLHGLATGPSIDPAATIREYFARSSNILLDKADHVVAGEAEESSHDVILVAPSTVSQAGLDAWSQADRRFFQSLIRHKSGKQARVVDDPVTLCGLRVC